MISRLKTPLMFGMAFYGISYASVKLLGYNSQSFMLISYLYIILGATLGLYYEVFRKHGGLKDTLDSLVIVAEEEEMKLKKLFSGEKYRLDGSVEKIE